MAPLHLGSPVDLAAAGLLLLVGYLFCQAIYNRFFHPLSKYPGPFLHHISYLPRARQLMKGQLAFYVADLHKTYGPVVRLTPNELAFSSPQAWRDIYGHKKVGEPEFPKSDLFYKVFTFLPLAIINADRDEHALLRRQLSHGFSDRSMKEQEPIIGGYVDLLVRRIRENLEKSPGEPVNMLQWLNWTAFDIIGDLGFGAAGGFGCLEGSSYHPWVKIITDNMRQSAFMQALSSVGLRGAIQWAAKRATAAGQRHRAIIREKVEQRLTLGAPRPDFLEGLIRKKDELGLDLGRLQMNASLIIIAGSDTTSTLLCGTLFFITTNPEVMKKLVHEVRTTFKSDDEITLISVNQLSYMLAVLNEALREYPPVTIGLPRTAPRGGGVVDGNPVPEGTIVSVYQWAINHNKSYWTDPFKFAPERFLGDERYKTDQLDAMQPFGIGPRNCIGQNLAYAEMRLVLAKLVYNFDMRLADEARGWLDGQKAYTSWVKRPLPIYMTPAVRE
ncbi:cytochrome P450 [Xylaria arbuscula]|nr:cytochrome P450 [Xylaria arbuscula]